ncbi:unnamed protein product, partial [Prorocentrum cordatum]
MSAGGLGLDSLEIDDALGVEQRPLLRAAEGAPLASAPASLPGAGAAQAVLRPPPAGQGAGAREPLLEIDEEALGIAPGAPAAGSGAAPAAGLGGSRGRGSEALRAACPPPTAAPAAAP